MICSLRLRLVERSDHSSSLLLLLLLIRWSTGSLYLFHTEDSPSAEFHDCISHQGLLYCRRPSELMPLNRDPLPWKCQNGGRSFKFSQLVSMNISVSTILHEWKSSLEMVEYYAEYLQQTTEWRAKHDKSLCRCHIASKFGKNCEYALIFTNNFSVALERELSIRNDGLGMGQQFGDILCYETIECHTSRLCLDWRDICDGIQQCMFGFDEENCDLLEFNECEDDEYRCLNGMCIPDLYFLDGEYDCMDLTDEMGFFNDSQCPFQSIRADCDDRICPPNEWSCGDGQCTSNRFAFQTQLDVTVECYSLRDQNFMCELNVFDRAWTSTDGRCFSNDDESDENETVDEEKSEMDICVHFFKCAFSEGASPTCDCGNGQECFHNFTNPCELDFVQYPAGTIATPYLTFYYRNPRAWGEYLPDLFQINGTIKCRGYLIQQQLNLTNLVDWSPKTLEYLMCKKYFDKGQVTPGGYDRDCYNHSNEFRGILCPHSGECISPSRIRDNYYNCADKSDENRNHNVSATCAKVKRHRFRCSANESTCLSVDYLGDLTSDCDNGLDESFVGTGRPMSKFVCNRQSKEDCAMIRQYVETSWMIDYDTIPRTNSTKTLPFRAYCDTFWDLTSKQDENTSLCRDSWECPRNFWKCRTGQCIRPEWILDREWDCADASDEQSLFLQPEKDRIVNRTGNAFEKWQLAFLENYQYPPLGRLCDINTEFPCILLNASSPWLNLTENRPCLHMSKLGDHIVDCVGGMDEKNTLQHCEQSAMLGDNFKCLSTDTCVPYRHVCDNRCPNQSDDDLLCGFQNRFANCSVKGKDYTCFDGRCLKSGWCGVENHCPHFENQYLCTENDEYTERAVAETEFYRRKKELIIRYDEQIFELPSFSIDIEVETNSTANETSLSRIKKSEFQENLMETIGKYFICNRGLHLQLWDESYVCLCPQFYYGDKCQYHQDRLTFTFHLNFSRSNLAEINDTSIVMKLLVIFLYEDQIIRSNVFHVRPALEKMNYVKKTFHFIHSRTDQFLEIRRKRYANRSDILHRQPFAIRVESYQLKIGQKPELWAVWQYPIRFDYLPSLRFFKILHLIEFPDDDHTDPCLSHPCQIHQQCHRLLNSPSDYVCLCIEGFGGKDCARYEPLCSDHYCAPNALCKPDYQGVVNHYQQPLCLCPTNIFGTRCFLEYDRCRSNPCQNGGTCFPNSSPERFFCHCQSKSQGERCESNDMTINLSINRTLSYQGALIQYLKIDFAFLDLVLIDQQPSFQLPNRIFYRATLINYPEIILVKLFSAGQSTLHIISVQLKIQSINRTTDVIERNHCPSVLTLFKPNEEVSPIKYHHLCKRDNTFVCFYDEQYLCICSKNRSRVDCFAYDHTFDRCSRCLAQGQCVRGNPLKSDHFICLCPRCHYGSLCQLNTEQFSFTVDSLLIEDSLTVHLIYLSMAATIIIIGGAMNYASFSTFRRPSPRRLGVGNYLLIFSILSQCSLLILTLKFVHIVFGTTVGDISCKIVSYLLSVTTRFTYWLMSWITIERVSLVVVPFNKTFRTPRAAMIISCCTALIIAGMHFHELLFYVIVKDPNGQALCVLSTSRSWLHYDRIIVLIHYIVPFCIQIISSTLLTILTAQSRSTTVQTNHRHSFVRQLKRQFHDQRELYLAPIIIILSGLPHIILSFSFACVSLSIWQRHAMLIAYFLSHAPQLLGFFLFVLPSSNYSREFQQTTISKLFIFHRFPAASK